MDDSPKQINIKVIMSYSDDLVKVLKNKKDTNNLMQSLEEAKMLQSSCETDFFEVQNSTEAFQKKVNACKQRIDEAKHGVIADSDIDRLQTELENELQTERLLKEELRTVDSEIRDLEHQKTFVEERKKTLNLSEKEELQAQRKLSMYASVTNIIPNLDDGSIISGRIVERDEKKAEKFQFDSANTSSFEICNNLWKRINP